MTKESTRHLLSRACVCLLRAWNAKFIGGLSKFVIREQKQVDNCRKWTENNSSPVVLKGIRGSSTFLVKCVSNQKVGILLKIHFHAQPRPGGRPKIFGVDQRGLYFRVRTRVCVCVFGREREGGRGRERVEVVFSTMRKLLYSFWSETEKSEGEIIWRMNQYISWSKFCNNH